MVNTDYVRGLAGVTVSDGQLVVVSVAPPWGEALHRSSGLDLRRTTPPIPDILDVFAAHFSRARLLFAIQIHETLDPASASEVLDRFSWSRTYIYDLNHPGQNHGIVLGTQGWAPSIDRHRE
jgi:hypothetical protein